MTTIKIEFNDLQIQEIDRLVQVTGLNTRKELFDQSMMLMVWIIGEVIAGKEIGSLDVKNNQFAAISSPVLDHVRRTEHSAKVKNESVIHSPKIKQGPSPSNKE